MVVIVNALRTPIGKFAGALSSKSPEELAKVVLSNNLAHAGLSPEQVDEVILGQTKQSAHAPNVARVAALMANFPEALSAYTVHRQCGSGMQAVHNAYMAIVAGQAEIVLAGGVESMSQAPYYMIPDRNGMKPGNLTLYDSNVESQPKSQPERKYGSFNMGETAEFLAEKYGISREEQDEFALHSQLKAKRAIANGVFQDEIVPVEIDTPKHGTQMFSQDEQPRDTSLEALAKLKPVFKQGGTVTAGNSSSRNDGAAALLLMKEERALALGYTPLARIRGIGAAGVTPKEMGLGPVPATQKALKMAGLELADIDLIELNEAFAAQSLAVLREWDIGQERVNVNGGAIALGHPLGCSGARILVTLVHEMQKRDVRYGLATLCIAGGQGVATIVEKWSE